MNKVKEVVLTSEEKTLLFDCLLNQDYALELVGSEIADIESGRKEATDAYLKQLNGLFNRLVKAGF